ncbi:MAG: photosynthetic complex putative assembly protein PuhB [Sphingomonadaceae bacterium]
MARARALPPAEVPDGLPAPLPPGERLLWTGRPSWRRLALGAFRLRAVALWFALAGGATLAAQAADGADGRALLAAGTSLLLALALSLGLLGLLAWVTARATRYTLTSKRLLLRTGVAFSAWLNLPLDKVASLDLRLHADGTGDMPVTTTQPVGVGWFVLWPHAQPGRIRQPRPMLRAVPDGARVATLIATALAEAAPQGRRFAVVEGAPAGSAAEAAGSAAAGDRRAVA